LATTAVEVPEQLEMTRPLRRAHRFVWLALSLFLPLLLALAVMARQESAPLNPAVRWDKLDER
jgi:hypothetical protein